jgi:hypothetical protein
MNNFLMHIYSFSVSVSASLKLGLVLHRLKACNAAENAQLKQGTRQNRNLVLPLFLLLFFIL